MISLLAFCLASYFLTRIALRLSAGPAGKDGGEQATPARAIPAPAGKKGQKKVAPQKAPASANAGGGRDTPPLTPDPASSRAEFLLIFSTVLLLLVTLTGYFLSAVKSINALTSWTLCALAMLAVTVAAGKLYRPWNSIFTRRRPAPDALPWYAVRLAPDRPMPWLLVLMAATVCFVFLVAWYVAARLEPSTLDALEYHLARIGYFLQLHSIKHYAANYYAQDCQPKIGAVAMLYAILVGNLNDRCAQLVQVGAYLVALTAVYGITRKLGAPREGGVFAALTFGLLTIVIAEASNAQVDLLFAAYLGCFIYALLTYRASGKLVHFAWACVALALAAGIKATVLFNLPSLALIAHVAWKGAWRFPRAKQCWAGLAIALAALIFITMPASYYDNLLIYHHPLGPPQAVSQLSVQRLSPSGIISGFLLNILRYTVDFLSFDGFWQFPIIASVQQALKSIPQFLLQTLGIHLEHLDYAFMAFGYQHTTAANEESSYWGILGFALVWPSVWIALLRQRVDAVVKSFAAAALLFFFVIALAMPYDFWHGRFFIAGAIYAVPVLAFTFFVSPHPAARIYTSAIVVLGCFSAMLTSLACKSYCLIGTGTFGQLLPPSTLTLHEEDPILYRCAQLTREAPEYLQGLYYFEKTVPATATVAIDVEQHYLPEYLFFGDHFSRHIIPVTQFVSHHVPLPPQTDYLLYSDGSQYATPGALLIADSPEYGKLYLRKMR